LGRLVIRLGLDHEFLDSFWLMARKLGNKNS